MLPGGFDLTTPVSEGPQNHALDRMATGTGTLHTRARARERNYGSNEYFLPLINERE